jgi:uncharacterized caspase-like protein
VGFVYEQEGERVREVPGLMAVTLLALTGAIIPRAEATSSAEPANGFARAALVIGNGDYTNITPLKNPSNDADRMCASLREVGYRVSCFTNILTRAQFRAILQDFAQTLSTDRVGLVYYAGHAMQINGENYLIPTGARFESSRAAAAQSVPLTYLMKQLQATGSPLKIVVIDACRDEIPQSLGGGSESAATAPLNVTFFPDDSFVLYSTADNERALDGLGNNGLLTKHLLAHLRDTGDLNDLFNDVVEGVKTEAASVGYHQIPEIRRNSTLRFCQVKCTELEELQTREEQATRQIENLRRQVESGDRDAQALIAAELKNQAALKKKEEQLARQAREREDKSRVIPAF